MYSRKVLSPIPAVFAASALVRHTRRACRAFSLRGVKNNHFLSFGVFRGFLAATAARSILEYAMKLCEQTDILDQLRELEKWRSENDAKY